ncbi:acyl-homoserine-lactone synthase [Roseovarius sp.]|uniref:acyl-homoserine-lactone synthase n=1 Tax=Roseovarius sp. TaxID=1486281 RepID=UPI0026340A9B|nr:acyl-homoserine-lactone synthase [Roseovarius sp.]
MLRYIFASELNRYPRLRDTMFRDRADQFKERLGWDVSVTSSGEERDEYDALNPLYVIWQNPDGRHGGSMRLLPTTGRVMVNEHFGHLIGDRAIADPAIWECTRFCLARGAAPTVARALMLAGGEVMRSFGIREYVGVFDARMVRIYRMIGASPRIVGSTGEGRHQISVGLWGFSDKSRLRVAQRAGLSPEISDLWFRRAMGARPALLA